MVKQIKELKLTKQSLFDLNEALRAGIELRQKARHLLSGIPYNKSVDVCYRVDSEILERLDILLSRVNLKITEIEGII